MDRLSGYISDDNRNSPVSEKNLSNLESEMESFERMLGASAFLTNSKDTAPESNNFSNTFTPVNDSLSSKSVLPMVISPESDGKLDRANQSNVKYTDSSSDESRTPSPHRNLTSSPSPGKSTSDTVKTRCFTENKASHITSVKRTSTTSRRSKSRERKKLSTKHSHKRSRSRSHRSRSQSHERSSRSHHNSSRTCRSRSRSKKRHRRSRSRDRHHRRHRSRSSEKHGHRSRHSGSSRRSSHRRRSRSPRSPGRRRNERLSYKEKLRQNVLSMNQKDELDGAPSENSGDLPLSKENTIADMVKAKVATGKVNPQEALMQTMAAMHQKAQELTGVAVPKYYNPVAVNPLKYAEQVQKRKLLWSKKDPEDTSKTDKQWVGTDFSEDQSGKMSAKFRKLMGIKEGAAAAAAGGATPCDTADIGSSSTASGDLDAETQRLAEQQRLKNEELMRNLDREYALARMTTHTHRGVGLGFTSQAAVLQHHQQTGLPPSNQN